MVAAPLEHCLLKVKALLGLRLAHLLDSVDAVGPLLDIDALPELGLEVGAPLGPALAHLLGQLSPDTLLGLETSGCSSRAWPCSGTADDRPDHEEIQEFFKSSATGGSDTADSAAGLC